VPVERRLCVSCRFFQSADSVSRGHCGHPDRQFRGLTPSVRAGELACRNGFDHDFWMPFELSPNGATADLLVSERPAPLRQRPDDIEPMPEAPFPDESILY
jgi:hypothetical protein